MYHTIVKHIVRQGFGELSKGNYDPIVNMFDARVHFSFSGQHALSGHFYSSHTARHWFARLYKIFPNIKFEILNVIVSGMPWNTSIATQFKVRATLPDGRPYENAGVQIARLKWGRIVEDHIYEDTQRLVAGLNALSAQGVSEAAAAPITG